MNFVDVAADDNRLRTTPDYGGERGPNLLRRVYTVERSNNGSRAMGRHFSAKQ